jgi:hypothetical protein
MAARKKSAAKKRGPNATTQKKKSAREKYAKIPGVKKGGGTGRGRVSKCTPSARARFLAALRDHGMVSIAAAAAGLSRTQMYRWREEDETLAREWDEAVEESYDTLEKEARRRAESGVIRPIYQGGKRVGSERVYSDSLMSLVLKGRRRRVYGGDATPSSAHESGVLRVRGKLDDDAWEKAYAK